MSGQVATRSLIRMRKSASIQEAARLMCDMSMGALGVDDDEHGFVGLITERDLMWAVAQGKDPLETRVKEIVNDFPIVVDAPISSEEAARRMISGHVRHLIIRDNDDLRILSMRDLLTRFVNSPTAEGSTQAASGKELHRMFGAAFVRK